MELYYKINFLISKSRILRRSSFDAEGIAKYFILKNMKSKYNSNYIKLESFSKTIKRPVKNNKHLFNICLNESLSDKIKTESVINSYNPVFLIPSNEYQFKIRNSTNYKTSDINDIINNNIDYTDYHLLCNKRLNSLQQTILANYDLHSTKLSVDLDQEVQYIKAKKKYKKKEEILSKIKSITKYFNWKRLLDIKNSQNYVKKVFMFLSRHIGTYKASMEALVEGQREVVHNNNFKFEDGESVKVKVDRFEEKFKENFNIREAIESKFK